MKTVFVLRHAAARAPGSAPTDFDRALKRRGHVDAVAVGEIMRARNFEFDAIVASPALRVVETVAGVVEGAGSAVEPVYDPRAYNAPPDTWLEILREADDAIERLMIVGHNPTLQELLLHLSVGDRGGPRGEVASGYPTATLAELRLAIEHWRDVAAGSGTIASLIRPGDTDSR
jgi:phosphohistidine phosphatase